MKIQKATRLYETWLAEECTVVGGDLRLKHDLLRRTPFQFLRGTFYRWMQRWPEVCPRLADAPVVPAVGDLHVENFGTWRDAEGRLVWGINDFDECAPLPYTNDLIRLTTSALLAAGEARLAISRAHACAAILEGYRRSLRAGGDPFVLDGGHHWLRHAAMAGRRPPADYWRTMARLPTLAHPPRSAQKALAAALPPDTTIEVFKRRIAGIGSLGRPRIVALTTSGGSPIAREAKAWVPSAAQWVHGQGPKRDFAPDTVARAVRAHDPFLAFRRNWIIRRLAPECGRIELTDLPGDRDERRLLQSMGAEVANVHLGNPRVRTAVLRHLRRQDAQWLRHAAEAMVAATTEDWRRLRR
jgi:hypothetical protein